MIGTSLPQPEQTLAEPEPLYFQERVNFRRRFRHHAARWMGRLLAASMLGVFVAMIGWLSVMAWPAWSRLGVVFAPEIVASCLSESDVTLKTEPEDTKGIAASCWRRHPFYGAMREASALGAKEGARLPVPLEAWARDASWDPQGLLWLDDAVAAWVRASPEVDLWRARGWISERWNDRWWVGGNATRAEEVGIYDALVASMMLLAVCLAVSVPLGIAAAIYLQEFAPRRWWVSMLEICVYHLASVPSIIYGMVGLYVCLGLLAWPRSSCLVGGVTLACMMLPTIVVTARESLRAIPRSLREAVIALGATPMQMVMDHILPMAWPGMLTGVMLAALRALGETAPLILVGMVAFIPMAPTNLLDPAAVLPVQIYLWSREAELGFQSKTAAAILVLLAMVMVMAFVAWWMRERSRRFGR